MIPPTLPIVWLREARLHAITERQCVQQVLEALEAGRGGWVGTMNLEHLQRLVQHPRYADLYRQASLVVADGMPLVWASRLQGTPLPERVTGSSLIWSLSVAAAQRGRSIFLLGGAPDAVPLAANALRQRIPALTIAGLACPPIGFETREEEFQALRRTLVTAAPDIVFVGLGTPKQEALIERLRGDLPAAWWLGVGISFSFVAGTIPRAPLWMQRLGLEWLHRLLREPRRLAGRYLLRGIPFALTLLVGTLVRRWSGAAPARRST